MKLTTFILILMNPCLTAKPCEPEVPSCSLVLCACSSCDGAKQLIVFQGKLHRTSLRAPKQVGGTQSFLCSALTAKAIKHCFAARRRPRRALLDLSAGNAHVRNKKVTKGGMHRRPLRPLPSGMPLRSFEIRLRYCVVARLRLNVVCSTKFSCEVVECLILEVEGINARVLVVFTRMFQLFTNIMALAQCVPGPSSISA